MAVAADQDQGLVGDPVTITATITADGLPVTNASGTIEDANVTSVEVQWV